MGNTVNSVSKSAASLVALSESASGRKLLLGIKANSKTQILAAIEIVKKERIKANTGGDSHEKQYDDMIRRMLSYLTGEYDIGDGVLFKKTPIQYARSLAADEAEDCIEEAIEQLKKQENTDKMSKTVGLVDADRVRQAKERLKEYQKTKNTGK
jgi:hypothetical protein